MKGRGTCVEPQKGRVTSLSVVGGGVSLRKGRGTCVEPKKGRVTLFFVRVGVTPPPERGVALSLVRVGVAGRGVALV